MSLDSWALASATLPLGGGGLPLDREPDGTRRRPRPPRRLVETARDLEATGARAVFGSVCRNDLGAPFGRVLEALAGRHRRSCPWP
ncbi:MAG TPA: hypothetical protein RMH99_00385 [Sandaracinaceae bacterium LLY-WYZ-13_1]|nr:hypothetical protein [Sandaracinaceae bacterium LLY-WYZ-13_1]